MRGARAAGEGSQSTQPKGRWATRIGQGLILGAFALRAFGCGLDTDSDHDGFYGADEVAGSFLFDCDDTDPTISSGEPYYRDSDGDGLGDPGHVCFICLSPTEATPASSVTATTDEASICGEPVDNPAAYVHNNFDCDDTDKKKGAGLYYYRDSDEDGLGDPSIDLALFFCPAGPDDKPPTGYVENDLDCNDDNDPYQDGSVKGKAIVYFFDSDGDTYGGNIPYQTCGAPPEKGYVLVDVADPRDCDDGNPLIHPVREGSPTVYDCLDQGVKTDNDCDGTYDEDAGKTWYKDADGDGFGDSATLGVQACPPPGDNYVNNNFDCNDGDGKVYPGAGCALQ